MAEEPEREFEPDEETDDAGDEPKSPRPDDADEWGDTIKTGVRAPVPPNEA